MAEQLLLIRRATPVDAEVCGKICFPIGFSNSHDFYWPSLNDVFASFIFLSGG